MQVIFQQLDVFVAQFNHYLAKPFGIALIAYFVYLSLSLSLSFLPPLHYAVPFTDYKVAYLQGISPVKLKTRSASKGSIKETIPILNSNW